MSEQISEADIYALTNLAAESLMHFMHDRTQRSRHVVFLAETGYCRPEFAIGSRVLAVRRDQVHALSASGIDEFIKDTLNDPSCRGLVPLTESARKMLTGKHELKQVATGIELKPEGVVYSVYRR